MAKKVYKVEIKGLKSYCFESKQEAEDYAITATAWCGGKYRIQEIFIQEEVVK